MATSSEFAAILRDASLRDAPQDEEWDCRAADTPRNFAQRATLMSRHRYERRRPPKRRSAAMARVISRCPLTGHYVFIGIDVDAERFANFPETFARAFCPF